MTTEMINMFMDSIIRGTLTGICLGFCILGVVAILKWFFGVMKEPCCTSFPVFRLGWIGGRTRTERR